jgi:LmbE family N-acetylglucosaminyl deacetylase
MRIAVTDATARLVADAVADIAPDIAFTLWPDDRHPDHECAARLAKIALGFADRLIASDRRFAPARRVYQFDNGPRHTIGFEPDTFIDVSDEWPQAIEWLGKLMALMRNQPFDASKLDGAQRAKETLALYRGQTCGVRYAEAVRGVNAYPVDVF